MPVVIQDQLSVTLEVWQWYWLLGLLAFAAGEGQNSIITDLSNQVMDKTL